MPHTHPHPHTLRTKPNLFFPPRVPLRRCICSAVFDQERLFKFSVPSQPPTKEVQLSPFLVQTETWSGSPRRDPRLPLPSQGLLGMQVPPHTHCRPQARRRLRTAGCWAQPAPFLSCPLSRWDWALLGALNVNSPPLPQPQPALTLGCPCSPLPAQTRPVGAGPRWDLSLEASFVCEVHLQGWERLLKTRGRPREKFQGGEERRTSITPWKETQTESCA